MSDTWLRVMEHMADRVSGPLHFRLIFQPLMATFLAVVAGLRDAKAGKPPYLWAVITDPAHRLEMMKDGWKSVGRLFILALVLDVVFQLIAFRFVYPGEAILVAPALAVLPYVLLRGLVTRLAHRK